MKRYILALYLVLCLMLTACGGEKPSVDDSTDGRITGVVDNKQTQDIEDTSDNGDTDDSTSDTDDTDTATEPDDSTSDTTEPNDTGISDTPDTEKNEDSTGAPDDTTDDEPIVAADVIDISAELAAGEFAQGQFVSHESKKLRLLVNYISAVDPTSGDVMIELEVWLESYDINCGARVDTGKIVLDGQTQRFSTDSIQLSSGEKAHTFFTTYTYQVPTGNETCTIDISWLFNGTYGGEKIDTLNASAVLIFTK